VKCEACGETIAAYYREILDAVAAAALMRINDMLSRVLKK
jgi:DNA-directed RNA polymerase subunit N (RpoN/RPB10)